MNIIWGHSENPVVNKHLGDWLAHRLGFDDSFALPYSTMGVLDGNQIAGVMLYNNYQPKSGVIEIHGAAITPRWLTRAVLKEMFEYPFLQLGCQNVIMRVSARDRRLPRILKSYGFKHVFIPRLRGREEGECIFWLTDDAWKANKFNQTSNKALVAG